MNLKNFLKFMLVFVAAALVLSSTAFAAAGPTVDTVGTQAKKTVNLENQAVQDSVIMPDISVAVYDAAPATAGDSLAVSFAGGYFTFAKSGPYKVVVNGGASGITADNARVNATGDSLFIKLTGTYGTSNADTLLLSGIYIKAVTSKAVANDSSTTDALAFSVFNAGAATAGTEGGTNLVLMPGPIYDVASITAQPPSPVVAGVGFSTTVKFKDKFGNTPYDKTTKVSVSAVLNGTSQAGNVPLGGTSTITANQSAGTYQWTALTYTKTEAIQLVFTPPSGTSVKSTPITINPNSAANISVALESGSSDTFTVDQNSKYDLTVTDAYFNPVGSGTTVTGAENTAHGGSFTGLPTKTDTVGKITGVVFNPSKYFVGSDTLTFSVSGSILAKHAVTITHGALGGVIVDYASTATGTAASEPGDSIAAGTQIYVRGFLRDTYGNPIDATSLSDVTFKVVSVLGNATLGTKALTTQRVEESQYQNNSDTAYAVAIPLTVSTKIKSTEDSVSVTADGYTGYVLFNIRSNVPATVKMDQGAGLAGTAGNDSSLVASNYVNGITVADTAWDKYGNMVTVPSSSVKLTPTYKSYAVYFSTSGLTKFLRATDTTAADTLYPNGGIINRTINSGKMSGIDTVKSWNADASVSKSMLVWVAPAAFSKLVITPAKDTTAIAGQQTTLTVEKEDAYGNHIDFGLAGNNLRGTYKAAYDLATDTVGIVADTVSTGKNRGGYTFNGAVKLDSVGKEGVASVGGSINLTFPFTAYTSGADTQKVYVKLGSISDTATVISASTGAFKTFVVSVPDTTLSAGDSVAVTVTAVDVQGNRIYTYATNGQNISLNHTTVKPISSKDTTFYFSYIKQHANGSASGYVKSTGLGLTDTIFAQGQATFWLHKFVVDSTNTITVGGRGFSATSTNGVTFKPLAVDGADAFGYWKVTAPDTITTNPFTFTVTPRDKYYNVNSTQQVIVNVASNQTNAFNVGSNPKVVKGVTEFTGYINNGAASVLDIYVFNNNNTGIYGQSSSVLGTITGVNNSESNLPKTFALRQNYPNPFNPTTNIQFDVPKTSNVKIEIYDVLGREVRTLVDQNMTAGHYTKVWNGLNDRGQQVVSGIYIYRMEAGSFVSLKKMILLK